MTIQYDAQFNQARDDVHPRDLSRVLEFFMSNINEVKHKLHMGVMPFATVAKLVLHLLGELHSVGSGGVSLRVVRGKVKRWADDELNVPLDRLPEILRRMCLLNLTVAQLDAIFAKVLDVDEERRDAHERGQSELHRALVAHQEATREDVIVQLAERNADIADLRQKNRALVQSNSYKSKVIVSLQDKVKLLEGQLVDLRAKVNLRPGKRNVSLEGGYYLALQRSLGYASTRTAIGMLGGADWQGGLKSKDIVVRFFNI